MCALLVGLPDVDVLGVDDPRPGRLVVVIEPRGLPRVRLTVVVTDHAASAMSSSTAG